MIRIKNIELKLTEKKLQTLFISVGISVVSGVALLIVVLIMNILPTKSGILLRMTLPTVISLVIIPIALAKFLNKTEKVFFKWSKKELWISSILIIAFSIIYCNLNANLFGKFTILFLLAHYFLAAFSEEFLYRNIILNELLESWNTFYSVLLCALIFAVIGHVGESPLDNLVYRFPLGVVFSIVRLKTNSVLYTSVIHAFYNLLLIAG